MAKKNFNDFTYGVGVEINANSFKQVKDDLKTNFDVLKKLVKSYEDILKINPDADLSDLFKQLQEIKSITDGINKSDNSFAGFVDKGVLQRVSELENSMMNLVSKSDQASNHLAEIRTQFIQMVGSLKQAGQIKMPGTYQDLFSGAKNQTANIKSAQDELKELETLEANLFKVIDSIEKKAQPSSISGNIRDLVNEFDDAFDIDNMSISKSVDKLEEMGVQLHGALQNLTSEELKQYGLTDNSIIQSIDDFLDEIDRKKQELNSRLQGLLEEQKTYESKVRSQSESKSRGAIQSDAIIDAKVKPKIVNSEWVSEINKVIGDIEGQLQPIRITPTFLKKSKNATKDIEDAAAKMSHTIDIELKVKDNISEAENTIKEIDKSIQEVKNNFSKLYQIPVTFKIGNEEQLLKNVDNLGDKIRDKLKDINVNLNVSDEIGVTTASSESSNKSKKSKSKKNNNTTQAVEYDYDKLAADAKEAQKNINLYQKALDALQKEGHKSTYMSEMHPELQKYLNIDDTKEAIKFIEDLQNTYQELGNQVKEFEQTKGIDSEEYKKTNEQLDITKKKLIEIFQIQSKYYKDNIKSEKANKAELDKKLSSMEPKQSTANAETSKQKIQQLKDEIKQLKNSLSLLNETDGYRNVDKTGIGNINGRKYNGRRIKNLDKLVGRNNVAINKYTSTADDKDKAAFEQTKQALEVIHQDQINYINTEIAKKEKQIQQEEELLKIKEQQNKTDKVNTKNKVSKSKSEDNATKKEIKPIAEPSIKTTPTDTKVNAATVDFRSSTLEQSISSIDQKVSEIVQQLGKGLTINGSDIKITANKVQVDGEVETTKASKSQGKEKENTAKTDTTKTSSNDKKANKSTKNIEEHTKAVKEDTKAVKENANETKKQEAAIKNANKAQNNKPKYTKEQINYAKKALQDLAPTKEGGKSLASSYLAKLGRWDEETGTFNKDSNGSIKADQKRYLELRNERRSKNISSKQATSEEMSLRGKLNSILVQQRKHLDEIVAEGEKELAITEKIVNENKEVNKSKNKVKDNKVEQTSKMQSTSTPKTKSDSTSKTKTTSSASSKESAKITTSDVNITSQNTNVKSTKTIQSGDLDGMYNELNNLANKTLLSRDEYNKSKTRLITDAQGQVSGAAISYKSKDGKTNLVENYKLVQDKESEMVKFVHYSNTITENAENYEKIMNRAVKSQNTLVSKYGDEVAKLEKNLDPNASKTLAGTQFEETFKSRISEIKEWVGGLEAFDDDNKRVLFSEEDLLEQQRLIDSMIRDAKKFADQSRNAVYPAEVFDTKDVSSQVKKYDSQLDAFIEQTKRAGLYTGEFKDQLDALKEKLGKVKVGKDLKEYQTELAVAKGNFSNRRTYNKFYDDLEDSAYRKEKLKLQINSDSVGKNTKAQLEQELRLEEEIYQEILKQLEANSNLYNEKVKEKRVLDGIQKATLEINKSDAKQADKNINRQNNQIAKIVEKAQNSYNKMSYVDENSGIPQISGAALAKLEQYNELLNKLKQKQKEINSNPELMNDKEYINGFNTLLLQMGKVEQGFNELKRSSENFWANIKDPSDVKLLGDSFDSKNLNELHTNMSEFANQVGIGEAQLIKFNDAERTATFSIKSGKNEVKLLKVAYEESSNALGRYIVETKKVESGSQKFFNNIKRGFAHVTQYLSSFGSVYEIFAEIRRGLTYVKEIDSALTDLKKVTSETDAGYKRFLQTMSKTAAVVGTTVSELTTMAAEWARLGYSMQQAGQLAESTAILMNVSEFEDATEASQALISTIQAFGYAADDSMHVVDILNEVKVTCLLIQ